MAIFSKRNRLHTEALKNRTMFDGSSEASAMSESCPFEHNGEFGYQNTHRDIAIPEYSSKPDAPATLYLDFRGHKGAGGENGHLAEPYGSFESSESALVGGTSKNDVGNSNSIEVRVIKEIWQAIAEKFAQFNVNVTTINPGDFSDRRALRVAVGGLYRECFRSMLQYR